MGSEVEQIIEQADGKVDLGERKSIQNVSCGFLQDENSWIFFPSKVEMYGSIDGNEYFLLGRSTTDISPRELGVFLEDFTVEVSGTTVQYIKVKATSLLMCPSWHKGAVYDGKAWLFADEITIE